MDAHSSSDLFYSLSFSRLKRLKALELLVTRQFWTHVKKFCIAFALCWLSFALQPNSVSARTCSDLFNKKAEKIDRAGLHSPKTLNQVKKAQADLEVKYQDIARQTLETWLAPMLRERSQQGAFRSVAKLVREGLRNSNDNRSFNWAVTLGYSLSDLWYNDKFEKGITAEALFERVQKGANALFMNVDGKPSERFPDAPHIDLYRETLFPGVASFEQVVELHAYGRTPIGFVLRAKTVDGIRNVGGYEFFRHDISHFNNYVLNMENIARLQGVDLVEVLSKSITVFNQFRAWLDQVAKPDRKTREDIFFLKHILTFEKSIVIISNERYLVHRASYLSWESVQSYSRLLQYPISKDRYEKALQMLSEGIELAG